MNRVRVGADFDGIEVPSEVTRVDFDWAGGTFGLVVEYLSSRDTIVVEIIDIENPDLRYRIANFPTK